MLLAVEGGGFFSSSASGYSKGLTLLLGQKSEDKPMRVSPWNQYQLVDQKSDTDFQLASEKNKNSRGCASFVCFGRASAGLEGQPAFKVGPTQQPQDTLPGDPAAHSDKEVVISVDSGNNLRHVSLKSSLKKRPQSVAAPIKNEDEQEESDGQCTDNFGSAGQRKVHWTDACGRELAEIREFEPSETGDSDDEFDAGGGKTCSCRIM
ncbi:hypothetical protein V2J09_017325 [Rumex salicifolius]